MVEQDRHLIRTHYNNAKGFDLVKDTTTVYPDIVNQDFNLSDIDNNDYETNNKNKYKNSVKNHKLHFEITLSYDEWQGICPIEKVFKNGRKGEILQDGWTDVLRQAIWNKEKLPCVYTFERHYVGQDYIYIKIEGHCTECKSKINLICEEKPTEVIPAKFTVNTINSKHIPHYKKLRLQKLGKLEVEKELLHIGPKQWRRDETKKQMLHGDPEPPHLYKLSQLRNARQDTKNKELGIESRSKLFDSLSQLKYNVEFSKFVKDIGYDPFFTLYWSPEQRDVYNEILRLLNNEVSLDATASITLKINRPGGDSSDIFLSIMCTYIDQLIVPITQALSEKNDSIFYRNWLEKWIQSGGNIPKGIVTDMGKAIQNGACLAFNSITFKVYKDTCLMILLGEKSIIKLHTQLRIDIAHAIHAVSLWPCFIKDHVNVKLFFIKCFGFATTIYKLEFFQKVLTNILTVAYFKYYDKNCQSAMMYLIHLIQTYEVDLDTSSSPLGSSAPSVQSNEIIGKSQETTKIKKNTSTHIFIDIIKNNVTSRINNDIKPGIGVQTNDYYLVDFGNRLADFSKDFVCWTNVMAAYFKNPHKVASSARSETHFGDLKTAIGKTIVRADKFLVRHMRIIDADVKLARAAINNLSSKMSKEKVQPANETGENYDIEHLLVVERWRNKICNIINEDETVYEINNSASQDLSASSKENKIIANNENLEKSDIKELNNGIKNSLDKIEISLDHSYSMLKSNIEFRPSFLKNETAPKLNEYKIHEIAEKPRGIHVSASPAISLQLHQSSTACYNRKANIKNGNTLPARRMNKQRIIFTNTCAFDSITELLSSACFKVIDFKNFMEKSVDDHLKKKYMCYSTTVLQYTISGVNSTLYTNRAHILYSNFKQIGSYVNCNVNISNLFSILMNAYDCTVEKTSCVGCEFKEEHKRIITFLSNLQIAWLNDYKDLEEEINKYFEDKFYSCKNYHKKSILATLTLGPYLWIDTDEAYRKSTYAEDELHIKAEEFTTCLESVPKTLLIKEETFVLYGVIKYIPPIEDDGMGHYTACCFNNSSWIERNDLVKYKVFLPQKLPNIKISSLFYVKSIHMQRISYNK